MLSFPSHLGADYRMRTLPDAAPRGIGELLQDMGRQFLNSATNRILGGVLSWVSGVQNGGMPNTERIPYDVNRHYPELILKKPEAGIRPSNLTRIKVADSSTPFWYENALIANPEIYSLMNTYRYTYGNPSIVYVDARKYNEKDGTVEEDAVAAWVAGKLSPSLFNPYYGIQKIGTTKNTPLLDTDIEDAKVGSFSKDFTDCSISTLCKLSADDSSELGAAKYKYADFMYCKDLGMPNNRMLTLRRFATPVGDMIFGRAATSDTGVYSTPGDIGRLVGYFDTEDNKLESILDYSFHASFEERTAETQTLLSREDERRSPLGMLLNTMSSQYRDSFNVSVAQGNNLLDWLVDGFGGLGGRRGESFDWLKHANDNSTNKWYTQAESDPIMYDKNKVFDPVDTVRKTHLYTGELLFKHEFTLTFNYTLRSYDNINPKSAMLDLLANATATCYKRGHFWGGRQAIIGAQPNLAGWEKANNVINQEWDKIGGFFKSLMDGGINISGMLGNAANMLSNAIESATSTLTDPNNTEQSDNTKKAANEATGVKGALGTLAGQTMGMVKAKMMNFLGRPQIYQFSSLLSGDNVGLWHLTIGNPRNPIAVMGNLIVTDCRIQQYGPLGQDDFPTGLKVIVTLQHARPRDMVDIQKMYTRGILAIYQNTSSKNITASTPGNIMYVGESNPQKLKRNIDEIA